MLGTSAMLGSNIDDSQDNFVMTSIDSDPMQKVVRALKGIKKAKNNAVGNKSMALIRYKTKNVVYSEVFLL